MYLRSFRNVYTITIKTDTPDLLEHLFATYGAVEPEELKKEEDSLRQKVFNIDDPLNILFNVVEKLLELATASGNLFSRVQQVMIGIQFIKLLMILRQGLHHGLTFLWLIKFSHDSKHILNLQEHYYAVSKVQLYGIQPIIDMPIKLQYKHSKKFARIVPVSSMN